MPRIKLLHCITDLSPDGAQRALLRVVTNLPSSEFENTVVSLGTGGHLVDQFVAAGVTVHQLGLKRGIPGPKVLLGLCSIIKRAQPDIIHGWMYHGNLAATVGAALARSSAPVLWNIRRCLYESGADKRLTRLVIRAGSALSARPKRIVYCVELAATQHEAIGFDSSKRVVIPNGFDISRFRPSTQYRETLRAELGLPNDCALVGIVGRYHPQKDYPNFLKAAKLLLEQRPDTHFIMIGRGVSLENPELSALVSSLNVNGRLHLLGERQNVPEILSALDLFVSSSANEGFSNVVGEAMASGIPCAATDAGASAELLHGLSPVVPRSDPEKLAGAALAILSMSREDRLDLGRKVRTRIEDGYSLERMLSQYADLYRSCTLSTPMQRLHSHSHGKTAQLS